MLPAFKASFKNNNNEKYIEIGEDDGNLPF